MNKYQESLSENVIKREKLDCIKYNYYVQNIDGYSTVIISDQSRRILKRIDKGIINPRKQSIFSKHKIDNNGYTILYVNNSYHNGNFGGNLQYVDKTASNIQEKIFIRGGYTYVIRRPEQIIDLLSDTKDEYDNRYITKKIETMIYNVISTYVSSSLNKYGFIQTQENLFDISKTIRNKIESEDILSNFGIEVSSLTLYIEESENHAIKRNDIDWQKYKKQENMEENNGII